MLKIAITGSTGLIGSRIIELLKSNFEFIELVWPQFDLTKKTQMWELLKDHNFDLFLHLAAYTNVDGAEKEKRLAFEINVTGTKNIFDLVSRKKKKFIYISTDFVFDGIRRAGGPPYFENSQPNPISYYAQTKFEAEKLLKDRAMIIRFSYPYRTFFATKKDFVRSARFLLEQKKSLEMISDSLITPTFIDDIAFALKYLFNNYNPEIFHIVGADSLSPFNTGKLIAKTFNLDQSLILPTTYQKYFKSKAKRPQYSEIKSKKNNFYRMKTFAEGLAEVAKQLRNS